MLYGEWLYAKHTVFYDALPHYFCEFDVYDRVSDRYLSTDRRRELLAGVPGLRSVPVLHSGPVPDLAALTAYLGRSTCRTDGWREALATAAKAAGVDPERALAETDGADEMEGLYVKLEEDGVVAGRYKWVRASFLTAILDSGSHWQDRPIVANQLAEPAVLHAGI